MRHLLASWSLIASNQAITTQDLLLLAPLVLISLALIVVALIDLVRREDKEVRGSKLLWGIVIVVIGTIGPIAYFVVGRKEA
ncbi:MAG: PLD nuclease N-terminal domain-containing protein [Chloroflexota bacterium]